MPLNEAVIYTKLAGVRSFLAGAQAETAALAELGLATRGVGVEMATTTKRSWLLNQSLFTLRRLTYGVTLGLIAGGAAAVKLGNDYNNAMQTATVALRPFFTSSQDLTHVLNRLWTIAKYTPFQIKDMTLSFRALYPALQGTGISADELITTIKNLIDALSVAGKVTPQALGRVTYALQHMLFQGRLTGRTVAQLASLGIPIFPILNKELGITGDQLHNIAKMGIPAQTVLQAINQWIEKNPGYANAALRQSQRTVSGLMSTFRDNVSQTMGMAEKGWFHFFQRTIVGMNAWFQKLQNNMGKSHDLIRGLDRTLTPQTHAFIRFWRQLSGAVIDFTRALKALGSTFTSNKPLWGALYGALVLLHGVFWALAGTTWLWVPGLKVLIDYLIVYYTVTKGAAFITFLMSDALMESRIMTALLAYYTFALAAVEKAATVVRWLATAATWAYAWATVFASAVTDAFVASIIALTIAIMTNPIGFLVTAVLLLIFGLAILYWRWQAFRKAVNAFATFLYQHPYFLGLIPGIGTSIMLIVLLIKHFQTLVHWAKQLAHWLGKIHMPHFHFPHLPGWLPHFQHGGVMPYSGPAVVGEGGPEIAHFPRGTSITPLQKIGGSLSNLIEVVVIPAPVNIDGQKVAQIVAKHTTTVNARA